MPSIWRLVRRAATSFSALSAAPQTANRAAVRSEGRAARGEAVVCFHTNGATSPWTLPARHTEARSTASELPTFDADPPAILRCLCPSFMGDRSGEPLLRYLCPAGVVDAFRHVLLPEHVLVDVAHHLPVHLGRRHARPLRTAHAQDLEHHIARQALLLRHREQILDAPIRRALRVLLALEDVG